MENRKESPSAFGPPEQRGNVTVYPAAPPGMLKAARGRKTRAAAYVRVSTDSMQQETSLILQKEHFETLIKNNPEYEFAGIYEDDGVTATNVEQRKGFLKMIKDCEDGHIDLVLTKGISRFARNLGDLLHYVNKLKGLKSPVEIIFETDKISTFGASGEILLVVLGLCAQEESRIKSESVTWAIDDLFRQGKYYAPAIYGFTKEKGRDKPLVIHEEEAKIVRLCFAMKTSGCPSSKIAKTLTLLGDKNWTTGRIMSLLSNEKYAGELRARKTVTPNYKTHKSKKNEGEKDQYYEKNHHAPIVPPLAFHVAQKIIQTKRGNQDGIPFLKAVPEGILKGFVVVDKSLRGHTLGDYLEASRSVCEGEDESESCFFADKVSIFDFRNYEAVSTLLFDDPQKPFCTIKDGKIVFNAACRKALGAEKVEMLFHPVKAILALRAPVPNKCFHGVPIAKPVCLASFVPAALDSAKLQPGHTYRAYGVKRSKNNEGVMFFDLRDAMIMSGEKDGRILPAKYAGRYGPGYYETFAACGLHKIDLEGLWQALRESRPADSLAGQIVELTEFCQANLAEFGLSEEVGHG